MTREAIGTRTIRVDMSELEFAFESHDHVFARYLDTQTGQILLVPVPQR